MNGPAAVASSLAAANAAANAAIDAGRGGGRKPTEAELNSYRIGAVADKLAAFAQPGTKPEPQHFFYLCLSLASELDMMVDGALQAKTANKDDAQGGKCPHVQRGIDYGIATNAAPDHASKLPPVLKQVCNVCRQKNAFFLQAAIMVLMISVKNACKVGWFNPKDTEELLALASEVGSNFGTMGDPTSELTAVRSTVSGIMSRFYPSLKLGHVIASLEVKPGYGTYVVDFHISKDISYSSEEKIRLFVAMKDNVETPSCIVSPQQVNFLLIGKGVERRTNVFMDPGPQLPTIVNPLLKYGTNLLQAVGQFNGHCIILIAFMSPIRFSDLPAPEDYIQHDSAAENSGSDSEIIEGPSRISLKCPISRARIVTPAKGQLCKHYQCFDLSNYVEINSKRPSWRCPHCNRSVCFADIRVDQKMAKILQEVGENVSEVMISADGSWTVASSSSQKDELVDKSKVQEKEGHEANCSTANGSEASCTVFDLTGDDDEMETDDRCQPVDVKPLIHLNFQAQPVATNSILPPVPRFSSEFTQHSSSQVANNISSAVYGSGTANHNMRSETQIASGISGAPAGISPVLTDAVSPALSRQPDNFQGNNYPMNSVAVGQFPASNNRHLDNMLNQLPVMSNDLPRIHPIPRNISRTPTAIQALPIQMPPPNTLQHPRPRPTVNIPAATGSSVPFSVPNVSNTHIVNNVGSSIERQRLPQQPGVTPLNVSNVSSTSLQNRTAPQVTSGSTPNPNFSLRMPNTLSQPPHLMRSSQVPRSHVQQGPSPHAVGNSPTTFQRIQLIQQQQQQQLQQQLQQQSQQLQQHLQQQQQQHLQQQQQFNVQQQHQLMAAQLRQQQSTPLQSQSSRMAPYAPNNTRSIPQAVSSTENLIDLQQEQNWRPSGRMRGSLTGQAYSAALSQFMGQASQSPPALSPGHRPPISTASPFTSPVQVLLANRMNTQGSQVPSQPPTDATSGMGAGGIQPDAP